MTRTDSIAHRIYLPELMQSSGPTLSVSGPEAHHALRVKRLRKGETVELFDGRGGSQVATLTSHHGSKQNPTLVMESAGERAHSPEPSPQIRVLCPPPKPDRIGTMVDQLSQVGASAWIPLVTGRTQGPSMAFNQDKLDRVVIESAKQCRRAWLIEITPPVTFEQAVTEPGAVLFEASGGPVPESPTCGVVLAMVGPEGGWTPDELGLARERGVPLARVGPHVMRLETAAVAAAMAFSRTLKP